MKCVILAGGIGSRFWPYSRKNQPKQLLNIFGEESMLQITVESTKKNKKNIRYLYNNKKRFI